MTTTNLSATRTPEREVVLGKGSDTYFGPISTDPTITFGGTQYRWVTQLSINGEKYGAAEGPTVTENLVVEKGEYINRVQAAGLDGAYNFVTLLQFETNRGKKWVLQGTEAPETGNNKMNTWQIDYDKIRLLSIGGSHGGLGDSLKQLTLRFLDNYDVDDQPLAEDDGPLFGIMAVHAPGKVETYEASEIRNLEAIKTISQFSTSLETEVTQAYLVAEATARVGFSYMNSTELNKELETLKAQSMFQSTDIAVGTLGVALARLDVKSLRLPGDSGTAYILIPRRGITIVSQTIEELRKKNFFDFSSTLGFYADDFSFIERYGYKTYHQGEST